MLRRATIVVCVFAFVALTAALASATAFTVANYTCTNLYGVPRNYNGNTTSFQAWGLTNSPSPLVSGVGDYAHLVYGVPSINTKMLLQCGPAGFGPLDITGYNDPTGYHSHNSNYDNYGVPTTGYHYNTGLIYDDDYYKSIMASSSGVFAYAGTSTGIKVGHIWSSAGGLSTPLAIANYETAAMNDSGLAVGGDWSASDYGANGVAYNTATGTSTNLPGAGLYVNNAGQVAGTAGSDHAYVWNATASTYWPAGSTSLAQGCAAMSISQNGRYVALLGGDYATAMLYDANTHSVTKTIAGETNAVNSNGWFGGDGDTTTTAGRNSTAWLWDGTTQHNLNTELHSQFPSVVSGYTICAVTAMNDYGAVLVWGKDSGGIVESFLLSPVPEPSTLLLLASGLIGLAAYAWRKRK